MSEHDVAAPLRAVENLDGAGRLLRVDTEHVTYEIDATSRCFRRRFKQPRMDDEGRGNWLPYDSYVFTADNRLVVTAPAYTVRSAPVVAVDGHIPLAAAA